MSPVDKILGGDIELGNVLLGSRPEASTSDRAARLLLAQVDGIPAARRLSGAARSGQAWPRIDAPNAPQSAFDPQDWGRKYLTTTGGACYVDLGHYETCIPEVRSAHAYVAALLAHFRIAQEACARANAALGRDERLVLMANNSDRHGASWGGHLNIAISRELFTRMHQRRVWPSLFQLAAFHASSMVIGGQGKIGSENGKPPVRFQISQRGDFIETLTGVQTTFARPLCNTRDEAHAGVGAAAGVFARLHVICHDTTLTQVSNFLKAGMSQLVLAMLECGWEEGVGVVLDDPVHALTVWGHDPDLEAVVPLADGRTITIVEHQSLFADAAARFVESGCAVHIPQADRIVRVWQDTLDKLARRDFDSLVGRLDWIMKRALLERLLSQNTRLGWTSPEIRVADLRFADLDPMTGLYWPLEAAGAVERLVDEVDICRAMREPPSDTRALPRTAWLRRLDPTCIESINWDEIRLASGVGSTHLSVVKFDDPGGTTGELEYAR